MKTLILTITALLWWQCAYSSNVCENDVKLKKIAEEKVEVDTMKMLAFGEVKISTIAKNLGSRLVK
jgi:hypothetical protein